MTFRMMLILGVLLANAAAPALSVEPFTKHSQDEKVSAELAEADTSRATNTTIKTKATEETSVTIPAETNDAAKKTANGPTDAQIRDWNAPIKGFHPIKRMLRPLWRLRQEAIGLKADISALQKPMAGLQPAFTSLEGQMTGVQNEMRTMGKALTDVNSNLHQLSGDLTELRHLHPTLQKVDRELSGLGNIGQDIRAVTGVRNDIRVAVSHLKKLQTPIENLQAPLLSVSKPLATVEGQLIDVNGKVVRVHTQLVQMESQIDDLIHQMRDLRDPMTGVSSPLSDVRGQLDSLNKLLTIILYMVAAVVVGTFFFGIFFVAVVFKLRGRIGNFISEKSL